ncbi:MAG: glycosyltransferase family A protein [Lachnospiraceae bacterium]|nr:glycosyltransferase family A protein [Lachnospiraceae bacterium]
MELLISALNCDPQSLIKHMNLSTNAVMVHQCDRETVKTITHPSGAIVHLFENRERGVGKSRNLALSKATDEIILFSDEDIVYYDGYESKVEEEFNKHPEADILLFNVDVCPERKTYWNDAFHKVTKLNCGRYPAYSIAARRLSLERARVKYSEFFGGGAKYSNGEDSLFLMDCLRAGLKLYATPVLIGKEEARESTWFHGFTEKFFFDRGVLFAYLYREFAGIWALRFLITKKEMFQGEINRKKACKLIFSGIKCGNSERKKL